MVATESWFRNLWKPPRKESSVIGVLAFEVASLMSKLLHLFHCLTDKHISRLREDVLNSTGIRKLVSDHDGYIEGLIYAEIIDNMSHVARAVARLATRCTDPGLKSFKHLFNDFITLGFDPNSWESSWKKMEGKTKKMERFISINANLYQEIEILRELEQNLRRLKGNNHDTTEGGAVNLIDFEKKVFRKRHEVRSLQDMSLWNKSYDYTVRLLVKSLFTVFGRIKHVFGIHQGIDIGFNKDSVLMNSDFNSHRNPSLSTLMQSSLYPSENGRNTPATRFSSGPLLLAKSISKFSPMSRTVKKSNNFYSGPLGTTKSGSISVTKRAVNFFSGPLGKPKTKPSATSGTTKTIQRLWQRRDHSTSSVQKKNLPLKGHMNNIRHNSPINGGVHSEIERSSDNSREDEGWESDKRVVNHIFSPKRRFLDASADTLGGAALALHYANVIIVIEKLVASPHLIGHDARDDLYNMLPGSVRSSLKEKLKPYAKSLDSTPYDTGLAGEWSEAMSGILEWLAPLAHNMIRWQSERSFEQHNFVSRTNVLLVQTLYFANQGKTEAIITELLVGLNYVWRFGREVNAKALLECASSKMFDKYVEIEG